MLERCILNKMKIIFFWIALLQIQSINLFSQNLINDTIIIWSKDYKLTIDDFQRKSKIDSEEKNIFIEGLCNYSIQYVYYELIDKVNVHTLFNRNGSYLSSFNDIDYVLKHEQLHFDIGEIYARKFRKWLYNYYLDDNFNDYLIIDLKFNDIINELKLFQIEYDNDEQLIFSNEN